MSSSPIATRTATGWIVRIEPDGWDPEAAGLVTGEDAIARYEARIEELGVSCIRCAD